MKDGEERRKDSRVPVNLRVKVQYENLDQFIEHFAYNISHGGMFLQSRTPHPRGTHIRFEVMLKTGQSILRGDGVVAWAREPAATQPPKAPGMGIKFTRLDDESRKVVERMVRGHPATKAAARPPPPPRPAPPKPAPPVDLDNLDIAVEAPAPPPTPTVEVAPELGARKVEGVRRAPEDLEVDISLDDLQQEPRPPPSGGAASPIIGIDLGTTNCCAAVVIEGKPQVIPSKKGYRTIPSIVAYTDQGRLLVGDSAKAQMEINPKNTVYGSKRLVGRPYTSPAVQQMKDRFHYQIIPGPRNQAAVRIVGREFSLQQVAAFILSDIRDIARDFLKCEVSRAVITVPAYYNENQRQAVREAGVLAGLQVERIVNEPTAAALAFGYNRGLDQRVLVYDLGGGTFDVSVLELTQNVYEVVATGGDTFLGGVDFDNQVVDYVLDAFCRNLGRVPRLDRQAMQRLRDAAELAKCSLSEKQETIIRLPFFVAVDNTPKDLEVRLTRSLLEELCGPLVERTIDVCRSVMQKARLGPGQINQILLVGGQSRMPAVWRRIQETFGREPNKSVHPDEAVALGAALLASSLDKIDSVVLIDVLPISIGIGIPGGRFLRVLEAGTALPTIKAYTIRTFRERQEQLELTIFQGENERVVNNEYLGTLTISGVTPAPKGAVNLEISFAVNQEGLLKITARELGSGRTLESKLASQDTADSLRQKLGIPADEVAGEKVGVDISLRRGAQPRVEAPAAPESAPVEEEKPAAREGGGLLSRLFGKKKG